MQLKAERIMRKVCIFTLLVVMFCGVCLTGCSRAEQSAEEDAPQALAVVLGAHGNSKGLNLNNISVQKTVADAVKSNGFVSVICIDGDPDLLVENQYEIPEQYANANKSKLEADAVVKANNILGELETVRADDPESDVLGSLRLAVRSFTNISDIEKTILVIDSGLSTTGVMDFKRNLIMADANVLADMLYERSAIPDFEGITVIWLQMGDTAAPQEPLTDSQLENLVSIWRTVIEKTGGTFVYSEAPPNPEDESWEYPEVSIVSLPNETPIAFDASAVELASSDDDLFQEPQILSEEQVKFIGDSAQYIDAAKSEEVISHIADYMENHPDMRLLLIGTTAGDETSGYSLKLSKDRAETVKATLISMGIASARIETLGMGSDDPWHITGAGTDMDDPLASANRKVVLLDASSEIAIELMKQKEGNKNGVFGINVYRAKS